MEPEIRVSDKQTAGPVLPEGMDTAVYERRKKEVEAVLAPFADRVMTPELAAEIRALMRLIEERWKLEDAGPDEAHGNA
jgi:hypothetical protein